MGNCQAIDNATLLIQHPSGRVDKLYCPVTASEIMKMNPGHYVALLLTTTTTTTNTTATPNDNNKVPARITRIKLLRPTDTLALGHVYRLITTQEVMKGLKAKHCAKLKQQQQHHVLDEKQQRKADKLENLDFEQIARTSVEKNQAKHDRHQVRVAPPVAAAKSRAWQPALQSISEAGS